jgi:hypothetical protein
VNVPPSSAYALLLDAVVPSGHLRADTRGWSDAQWHDALHVADWHRLSPLLYCHLKSADYAPEHVLRTLERAYLSNAARNLFIGSAQTRVLEALSTANVPAMLLKGAALIETCYADPAQREMLDLDLLVPSDLVDTGSAALQAIGYQPDEDGVEEPKYLRLGHHHDAPLVGEEQLVAVELHRHLTIAGEGTKFDIDDVWRRSREAPAGTHRLPADEDLLLHVCLHFTRNRIGGSFRRRNTGGALAQIGDIARILEREQTDWEELISSAHRYGLATRVFLALVAARELGVQVPGEPLAGLQPPGFDPRLGQRLVELRVLRSDDHLPVRSVRWMVAPSRDVLVKGWDANPGVGGSLARAYVRRAWSNLPGAARALKRPLMTVQDRRLNGEIYALEDRG